MGNFLYSQMNLSFQKISNKQIESQKRFNEIISKENQKIEKRNLIIAFMGLLIGMAQIIDNNIIIEFLKEIDIIKVSTFSVFGIKILLIVLIPSLFVLNYFIFKYIFKIPKQIISLYKRFLR